MDLYCNNPKNLSHAGTDPVPIDLNTLVAGETEYTPDMFIKIIPTL